MVGSNSMTLNEATLVSALQCYFDKLYGPSKITVKSLKPAPSGGGYGHGNEFEVQVAGEEQANG